LISKYKKETKGRSIIVKASKILLRRKESITVVPKKKEKRRLRKLIW